MPIQLFRVENNDGQGMYRDNSPLWEWPICAMTHPTPDNDPSLRKFLKNFTSGIHYFAFGSLEQLNAWLYDEEMKQALVVAGFVINVYTPRNPDTLDESNFIIGDKQAIFDIALFQTETTLQLTEV